MDVLVSVGTPDGFAVQLCDYSLNPGSKSGNMWIGGYDSSFVSGPMVFASIIRQDWFNVQVNYFIFILFLYHLVRFQFLFLLLFFPSFKI